MQTYLARGLAVLIVIAVAVLVFAVAWGPLATVGMVLTFVGDALTASDRLPQAAPVIWAFWGAVAGGAVGLWLVAESAGIRNRRSLVITLPLAVLMAIAAFSHVV